MLLGGGAAYMLLASPAPRTEVAVAIQAPPVSATLPPAVLLPVTQPPAMQPPTQIVTPQPPPVTPPVPPAQMAIVAPSPAAIRAALAAAAADPGCSLLNADVTDGGNVVIGGVVGRSAEAQLRRNLSGAVPGASLDWLASGFDGPYCKVLDAVRGTALRTPGRPELEVALKGNLQRLHNNDSIVPRLTMPDFPAYLQVTYFASDGTMAHLQPSPQVKQIDLRLADGRTQTVRAATVQDAARQFPARAVVTLGDPATSGIRPEEIGWTAAEPFGRDLLLVVASSTPLFAAARPADEPPDAYLRDLQAAMDAATRKGGAVTARVMLLELVP